jgi:hypothetical protein
VASSSASKLSFPRVEQVRVPKKRTGNITIYELVTLVTKRTMASCLLLLLTSCHGNTKRNWIDLQHLQVDEF